MESKEIKTVGIVVKPNHTEAMDTAEELSAWLKTQASRRSVSRYSAGKY